MERAGRFEILPDSGIARLMNLVAAETWYCRTVCETHILQSPGAGSIKWSDNIDYGSLVKKHTMASQAIIIYGFGFVMSSI
jgi:hypothetical protein